MKQTNSLFTCVVFITILSVIISCSKEGPAGPAGPAGSTGPQGGAGPKGDTGVANIIYSDWQTLPFVVDTQHIGAVIDTIGSHYNWNVPKLTVDILNKGEIKVYINFGTTAAPDVAPIPYFDSQIILNDEFFLQNIFLYSNARVNAPFRYILIPGSVHGRSAVDWNNYESVKKYLGLKD
jgi:hypothetical protein